MGKRQKQLSHEEVWDDSALIGSWNDALAEYQFYHSIHARGERVEDVSKDLETPMAMGEDDPENPANVKSATDGVVDGLEDGEVEEESESGIQAVNNKTSSPKLPHANDLKVPEQSLNGPSIPQMVISNTTDEALKNLMISWYYAGYYTGLYEGQQKSVVTANKSSDKINKPATEGVDSQDASS